MKTFVFLAMMMVAITSIAMEASSSSHSYGFAVPHGHKRGRPVVKRRCRKNRKNNGAWRNIGITNNGSTELKNGTGGASLTSNKNVENLHLENCASGNKINHYKKTENSRLIAGQATSLETNGNSSIDIGAPSLLNKAHGHGHGHGHRHGPWGCGCWNYGNPWGHGHGHGHHHHGHWGHSHWGHGHGHWHPRPWGWRSQQRSMKMKAKMHKRVRRSGPYGSYRKDVRIGSARS